MIESEGGAILHACQLEDACKVGTGSIIFDGVVVEKNAEIAPGSLVPAGKRIPSGQVRVAADSASQSIITILNATGALQQCVLRSILLITTWLCQCRCRCCWQTILYFRHATVLCCVCSFGLVLLHNMFAIFRKVSASTSRHWLQSTTPWVASTWMSINCPDKIARTDDSIASETTPNLNPDLFYSHA
jgi:hypothetical protein